MAWLANYTKRIKITTDFSKVDATLANFPITVFFTAAQGEEIFTEFDADSDYMKGAFTLSDGTTQLYAEKELFDHSASLAIYHVKVTSISSSAGTDIYYYYNNSIADNTTYIGAINTTAGGHVWESNFRAVYHMVDATTSTIVDSTTDNYDGTKKAANEPIEIAGKVSKGQDFDGTDDIITISDASGLNTVNQTIELLWKAGSTNTEQMICKAELSTMNGWNLYQRSASGGAVRIWVDGDTVTGSTDVSDGAWYHIVVVRDGTDDDTGTYSIYVNGVLDGGPTELDVRVYITANDLIIGENKYGDSSHSYGDGIQDEVRIQQTVATAAYAKATYNSLFDTLLTYGSEETESAAEDNSVFFGCNF